MASITINLGDAFLLDTPPNKQHLYIAIAKTSESKYLFVNTTKKRPNYETKQHNSKIACTICPGEGVPEFIKDESVIAYKFALELDSSQLVKLITPRSPIPKGRFSTTVLQQIQYGGLVSKHLRNKYKDAIKACLGIS